MPETVKPDVGGQLGLGADLTPNLRQRDSATTPGRSKNEVVILACRLPADDRLRHRWQGDDARLAGLLPRFVGRGRKHDAPAVQLDLAPFEVCGLTAAASGKGNQSNSICCSRSDAELGDHSVERLK